MYRVPVYEFVLDLQGIGRFCRLVAIGPGGSNSIIMEIDDAGYLCLV